MSILAWRTLWPAPTAFWAGYPTLSSRATGLCWYECVGESGWFLAWQMQNSLMLCTGGHVLGLCEQYLQLGTRQFVLRAHSELCPSGRLCRQHGGHVRRGDGLRHESHQIDSTFNFVALCCCYPALRGSGTLWHRRIVLPPHWIDGSRLCVRLSEQPAGASLRCASSAELQESSVFNVRGSLSSRSLQVHDPLVRPFVPRRG